MMSELMGTALRDADEYVERKLMQFEYQDFLNQKAQLGGRFGFDPISMPSQLFDFQQSLV